jgi:predicted ribosomally synthesized peptide with SipW-like signal peptide
MKKILISLLTIAAVASAVTVGTRAVFSDQAVLGDNTFATGTIEIRVNSQERATGFNFTGAAPGDSVEEVFTLSNYGSPHFTGPSTLDAKELVASSQRTAGSNQLYNQLNAMLYANAGWSGCSNSGVNFVSGKGCEVYSGPLKDMNEADILHATQWGASPDLATGNSLTMTLVVELPTSAPSSVQGTSTTFDLLIDAYNPHR